MRHKNRGSALIEAIFGLTALTLTFVLLMVSARSIIEKKKQSQHTLEKAWLQRRGLP